MKSFEFYNSDFKADANSALTQIQQKAQAKDSTSSILGKRPAQTEATILIKETLQNEEGIVIHESKE
jgi:hypothetical protein